MRQLTWFNLDILKAIDEAAAWLDIDGVESVGQGKTSDGQACIDVGCSRPPSELQGRIPDTFMDYPVVLCDWGEEVHALD